MKAPRWRAAAALTAVAVILLLIYRPRSPGTTQIESLTGDAPQPREELVLRWSELDGARYLVTLSTKDQHQLFRANGLTKPEATVPEVALKDVPAGAELSWHVEATLAGGAKAESPAFPLKLR
jgi:hypothetical protein